MNDQKRNDGGSAFPVIASIDPHYYDDDSRQNGDRPGFYTTNTEDGMSLRDYFAAAALTGLLVNPKPDSMEAMGAVECASEAYALADAMLKVRDDQ